MAEECGAGSICIQRVSDSEPSAINAVDLATLIPGMIRHIDREIEDMFIQGNNQTDINW